MEERVVTTLHSLLLMWQNRSLRGFLRNSSTERWNVKCFSYEHWRGLGLDVFLFVSDVVSEVTGRDVSNPVSKFDKRTAGGERSLQRHLSSLKDPSVEREQVSAEQLSPSLEENKLWTYSSKGASVSVGVIAQLALYIHRWRLPSSSLEPVCLRWQSFNQTAQCLRCVLRILLAPHFPVCQYSINAPSCVLPPSGILWKGRRRKRLCQVQLRTDLLPHLWWRSNLTKSRSEAGFSEEGNGVLVDLKD